MAPRTPPTPEPPAAPVPPTPPVPPEPPYLAIAAELRRRVRTGELSPGDRFPSTRAITRDWGVAMATATKALAVLRQEGLARPEPGVGTVVVSPAPRATRGPGTTRGPEAAGEGATTPASASLAREQIVAASLELADAEGLNALTMRRVATTLGVSTMALYRHVPGKAELVRLMTDAACGEVPLGPVPAHWRTGLEQGARWLRAVYARHRWMAHAMASFTRPVATPNAMAYTEWVLRAMRGTPLTQDQKLHTHLVIFAYVQGLSMADDLEEQARQDSGISDGEWMEQNEPRFDAIQSAGSYPELASVTSGGGFGLDLRTLFEFGLGRTLDGIASMIDETSG